MAYLLSTFAMWVIFGLLVSWRDWRKYYPVLIFTALLATVCDLSGVVFDQWIYHGPVVGGLSLWSDLGIAPAEGGIFVRLYPVRRGVLRKIGYLLGWSAFNAFFEWYFVRVGWIGYDQWNPIRAFIFYVLFFSLIWVQEYWYNGTGRLGKGRYPY